MAEAGDASSSRRFGPFTPFYFNMNRETEEWYYAGGSIHKTKEPGKDTPGWKWADINAEFNPNDPDDDWTREGAAKISDLEKTFGKYLHKALTAPPLT